MVCVGEDLCFEVVWCRVVLRDEVFLLEARIALTVIDVDGWIDYYAFTRARQINRYHRFVHRHRCVWY